MRQPNERLYDLVTAGLEHNARINDVPVHEGWAASTAIETYLDDATIRRMTGDQYDELLTRVDGYLLAAQVAHIGLARGDVA